MVKVCLGFYKLSLSPQIKIHFCQGSDFGTLTALWLLIAKLSG